MISVQFDGISKNFGANTVVDDLSLTVQPGELFFLLGPSGCGKTTCLRLVAGFYNPDGGALRFDDRVVNNVPPHKRNTGMVFQNYALWPHLTVKGNVEYGLKVRKLARDERERRTAEALAMVRLEEYADRYPNQLSGGQQQRVALARALVIRPDVLLLDEPLSNLDAQLRLEMRREIKRLHEQTGVTAIYVTHDQNEALSIADRLAVMEVGKLRQIGSPREVYRAPQTRFVASFLGETNFLEGVVDSMDATDIGVETALGRLLGRRPTDSQFEIGQQVWCSIRPEALAIATAEQTAANAEGNTLEAVVESVMYLGETEQLSVRLVGGRAAAAATSESWRQVKVSLLNPRAARARIGESVRLQCAADDVVVLAE
jgi:iron(III) transport system ATP-binding protein